ncbi:MAG: DUF5677 domain-containing protein [Candidatus Nealsonbacteria bacterium]
MDRTLLKLKSYLNAIILGELRRKPFSVKRQRSILLTNKHLKAFYPVYKKSTEGLLDAIDLLVNEVEEKIDERFNRAALILLSRSVQHFESVIILTENGLYGDAISVLRNILSDMLMMNYLHLHPELIELFLKESTSDYHKSKEFRKAFIESTMIEELQRYGSVLSKETFSKLSKASHASSWGVQFYSTKSKRGKQQNLKYGPGFEAKKALMLLSMILSGPWDFLNIILHHRRSDGLDVESDAWRKIQKVVDELDNQIRRLSSKGIKILLNWKYL